MVDVPRSPYSPTSLQPKEKKNMQLTNLTITVKLADLKLGIIKLVHAEDPTHCSSSPSCDCEECMPPSLHIYDPCKYHDADCECDLCDEWVVNVLPARSSTQQDNEEEEEEEGHIQEPTITYTLLSWQRAAVEFRDEWFKNKRSATCKEEECAHGIRPRSCTVSQVVFDDELVIWQGRYGQIPWKTTEPHRQQQWNEIPWCADWSRDLVIAGW